MNFEAVIGLEIHVEMKTRSKMFSSAPVTYGKEPNTALSPFDLAFPGTMPTVNEEAVRNGIRLAHALGMEIDPLVRFDRKNYFYSDLPKGFQITQQFHPIGRNGSLLIRTSRGERRIGIERIHLEEDTAKITARECPSSRSSPSLRSVRGRRRGYTSRASATSSSTRGSRTGRWRRAPSVST